MRSTGVAVGGGPSGGSAKRSDQLEYPNSRAVDAERHAA